MIVVSFFHSKWASAREINRDTKTELDANLRLFYAQMEKTTVEAHCWDLGMV